MEVREESNAANHNCAEPKDLFDGLQSLWDHFQLGLIWINDDELEALVDCPYCNYDYNYGVGNNIFCEDCRSTQH